MIGRRFTADVVQEIAPANFQMTQRLGELVNLSLLIPEDAAAAPTFLFKHALTRDVAYHSIPTAERQQLHGAVADATARMYAADLREYQAILAQHYLAAGQSARALPFFLGAAEHAQQQFANREAILLYGQAITILTAAPALSSVSLIDLHTRVGDIQTLVGEYDGARQSYQAAQPLDAERAPLTQARLARLIAATYEKQAEYEAAKSHLATAHDWVAQLPRGASRAYEQAQIDVSAGWMAFLGGDLDQAEPLLTSALTQAQRADDVTLQATSLRRLAGVQYRRGDLPKAQQMVELARHLSESINDQMATATALMNLGILAQAQSTWAAAERFYTASKAIYLRVGDVRGQIQATLNMGAALLSQGQVEGSQREAVAGYALAQRIGDLFHAGLAKLNEGEAAFYLGDTERARRCCVQSIATLRQTGSHRADQAQALALLARIAFRGGHDRRARRLARAAEVQARATNQDEVQWHSQAIQALVAARAGDQATATALLAAVRESSAVQEGVQAALWSLVQAFHAHLQLMDDAQPHERAAQEQFARLGTPAVLRRFL